MAKVYSINEILENKGANWRAKNVILDLAQKSRPKDVGFDIAQELIAGDMKRKWSGEKAGIFANLLGYEVWAELRPGAEGVGLIFSERTERDRLGDMILRDSKEIVEPGRREKYG